MVFLAGLILTLTELIGDTSLKMAVTKNSPGYKIFGHVAYLLLSQVLFELLKTNDLAVMNASWDTLSNVVTLIVSRKVFNEKITSRQYLGLTLCISGIYFLEPEK